MKPTPEQEAVFAAVADRVSHLTVEAVAGSGKTHTSVEAAKRASGSTGFVAFNSHIAAELRQRLGGCADASTLHSLGWRAVLKAFPGAEIDETKPYTHLGKIQPRWFFTGRNGRRMPTDSSKAVVHLVRLCKYTLTDETCLEDLQALVEHYGVEMPANEDPDCIFAAVPDLIAACEQDTASVDYDDQVWFPIRKQLSVGGYDTLFVDEAQDLSRVQQTLARKAGARLIVVGDRCQAIYGFAGSDCDALPRLCAELGATDLHCLPRPLTVTFRCPQAHVDMARQLVPQIRAADHAVAGIVATADPRELQYELLPGDLAICRCNAPLIDLAYRLIAAGTPTMVRGRDLGRGMTELVNRLKPADPADLGRKLSDYEKKETARLERRNAPESAFQSLTDRVQCLDTLASQCDSIDALRDFIAGLFSDDGDSSKIVLSSVHRAKGLEAGRVVIVAPEKLPLVRKDQKSWERLQELNLCYIAVTRAKRELIFAGDVPALFRTGGCIAALPVPCGGR